MVNPKNMVIYCTTNLINGKKYVGRDAWNRKSYLGGGKNIKKAIKKYGKENFKKEILEFCKDKEELLIRETYWLNYFDAANNPEFYNLIDSNKGWEKGRTRPERKGIRLSDEVRKKISEGGKGKVGKNSGPCKEVIQYRYEIIKTPIKTFKSSAEAGRELGISSGDITSTCNGRQLTAGGFIWSFK